jgi:hypothetical protein
MNRLTEVPELCTRATCDGQRPHIVHPADGRVLPPVPAPPTLRIPLDFVDDLPEGPEVTELSEANPRGQQIHQLAQDLLRGETVSAPVTLPVPVPKGSAGHEFALGAYAGSPDLRGIGVADKVADADVGLYEAGSDWSGPDGIRFQRLEDLHRLERGRARLAAALAEAFSREELGRLFDDLPDSEANPTERALVTAVGTAWSEYSTLRNLTRHTEQEAEQAGMGAHPERGDEVEAWLKRRRDSHVDAGGWGSPEWHAVDSLLDDYREHADTGTPLDLDVIGPGGVE